MRKILEQCPTCSDRLIVTQLNCPSCETTIQGRYQPCPFCQLSPENLHFLEIFVRNKGNVKDMERELGVSYWTIRNRLNDVVEGMGLMNEESPETAVGQAAVAAQQRTILAQLEEGKLSVAEAAEQLSQL